MSDIMKNTIMYYYDFDNPIIYKWNKKIYIKYNSEKYLFQPIYIEEELIEIYNLLNRKDQYYKIIKNKFNNLSTIYQGQKFVLLRLNEARSEDYEREVLNRMYIPESKYNIDRSNWYFLWSQKNDYFEYQLSHISGKYPLIDESIDYYIGLAETAISYVKYNNIDNIKNTSYDNLSICHRRINKDNIFNPLNVVVDHKERDIAEYLKYLFFARRNNEQKIKEIINAYKCTISGYYRLYARLLYPSYYFDIYEAVINEKAPEEELKTTIKRIDEYELYLQTIFDIMYPKSGIKRVEWIQKK